MDLKMYLPRQLANLHEEIKFKRIPDALEDDTVIWLVGLVPNEADHIYFCDTKDINSQGYGGSTLQFIVVNQDGSEQTLSLKGPWHSNSDALFERTGYDCTDLYYTRCIISYGRRFILNEEIATDVIWYDKYERLGLYDRGKEFCKMLVNILGVPLHYFQSSRSGSSSQFIFPREWKKEWIEMYWQNQPLINEEENEV